jgi:hypothetical protein
MGKTVLGGPTWHEWNAAPVRGGSDAILWRKRPRMPTESRYDVVCRNLAGDFRARRTAR